MAFGYLQSVGAGAFAAEPVVLAYEVNVTAGSLLVAGVLWQSGTATCSVSDSVNGAWTAVGSPQTCVGDIAGYRLQMFYFIGAAAGATTVTADISAAVNATMAIHEYSGTSVAVDGTPAYNNTTGSPAESASVTTTVAGTLLFSVCITGSAVNAAGTGYVLRERSDFASNGTEDDLDGGASGSKTATFAVDSGATDHSLGLIAFREGGAATQVFAPSADSVDGNWTNQAGNNTDLFDSINETTASDTDYIRSELSPANSATRIKLASGGDPQSSTGHEINWRIAKDAAGGQTIGMTVKLYQGGGNSVGGGTLIASFIRSNVTNTFTDFAEALSGAEADSITNYADLYLEFWANAT